MSINASTRGANMDSLKKDVVVTMCMLEMTMPPIFFHTMMHLVLHLVEELHMCGLAHKSWCIALNKWTKFWKGILGIPHALRLFDGGKIFHGQIVFGASYIIYATILTNKEVGMGSKRGGWCNWEGFGKNTNLNRT